MSEQKQMDDGAVDTIGAVEATNGSLQIDAGPLHVGLSEGVTGGLRVIQNGDFLMISQGVDYPDGDEATVAHELTPDEARKLAELLETAADNADDTSAGTEKSEKERQSLLNRAIGVVNR